VDFGRRVQHLQFLLLLRGYVQRFSGTSDGHTQVCIGPLYYSMNF
jgi:hypothetical protein